MREVSTQDAPVFPDLPLSQAIEHNDTIYLSGQVAVDPATGEVASADVAGQTAQIFENMSSILEAAGSSLDRLVKVTVFLTDIDDFAEVNEIYGEYVTDPYPARSAVEISKLAEVFETDFLVEIEAIAAL